MKGLIIFTLAIGAFIFIMFGFGSFAKSTSAVHDILSFMCIGFGGLFIGQIGAMLK